MGIRSWHPANPRQRRGRAFQVRACSRSASKHSDRIASWQVRVARIAEIALLLCCEVRELHGLGFPEVEDIGPDTLNLRYVAGRTDGLEVGPVAHIAGGVIGCTQGVAIISIGSNSSNHRRDDQKSWCALLSYHCRTPKIIPAAPRCFAGRSKATNAEESVAPAMGCRAAFTKNAPARLGIAAG